MDVTDQLLSAVAPNPIDVEVQELVFDTPDPNGEEFDDMDPETPFDIDAYDYESEDDEDSEALLDSELKLINAQLQWEESLEQVNKLFGWVIFPLIGKVLGRRMAGVIWRKLWDYYG